MKLAGRRILVVTKHLLNLEDAQAQQSHAVLEGLKRSGAHLNVICAAFDHHRAPGQDGLEAIPAQKLPIGRSVTDKIARKVRRNTSSVKWLSPWARDAARRIVQLVVEHRYDCILSLGLPMESHIAVLEAEPSLPWLAYFSDPWPEAILPAPMSDFAIPGLTWLQRQTVLQVLVRANALAFSCREQHQFMAKFYPQLNELEYCELPHVAPPFEATQTAHRSAVKLVHAGSIGRERVCLPLCGALAKFAKTKEIEVHFAGAIHPDMLSALQALEQSNQVHLHGWLSSEESTKLCRDADALLLIEGQMTDYPFLPSKVASYAAVGRPILAVTGARSPVARLIANHRAGIACVHEEQSILDGLGLLIDHPLLDREGLYSEFDEQTIMRKLDHAITSAITSWRNRTMGTDKRVPRQTA